MDDVRIEQDEPQRSRRRVVAVVALVTAAVLVTGLVVALVAGDDDGGPADDLPSPRSITRDGVTYDVGLTVPAAATLDPASPREVTVYVFAAENPEQPECSMLRPQARLVEETSTAVRIATYAYWVQAEEDEPVFCSFTGEPGADYRAMTLTLDEPLGGRRIVDEKSGEDIGHLDPDYVPTPAWVPRGFTPQLLDPMLAPFSGFTPEGGFRVSRMFVRGRDASIDVDVRTSTGCCETGDVVSHDDVGGHEATIAEDAHHRCVSWSPLPGIVTDVCSAGTLLSADELLRVARSVPEPERVQPE